MPIDFFVIQGNTERRCLCATKSDSRPAGNADTCPAGRSFSNARLTFACQSVHWSEVRNNPAYWGGIPVGRRVQKESLDGNTVVQMGRESVKHRKSCRGRCAPRGRTQAYASSQVRTEPRQPETGPVVDLRTLPVLHRTADDTGGHVHQATPPYLFISKDSNFGLVCADRSTQPIRGSRAHRPYMPQEKRGRLRCNQPHPNNKP
jgi:hypothetical protein